MSLPCQQQLIGFPPGLLGDVPLRMPVIGETNGWIALAKPAGIGLRAYPWDHGVPHMDAALNRQLQAGKPELLKRGATLFGSTYYLDPAISGVALFAKHRASLSMLRNMVGSAQLRFRFLLVTTAGAAAGAQELIADAPLLAHRTKPKMIPSTANGKKAHTQFRRLAESGSGWALWEGLTTFIRPHQIRAHAAVHGLSILGDVLYGGPEAPLLRELLPNKRSPGTGFPVFNGVALHLRELTLPESDSPQATSIHLRAQLPRHLCVMLQRMQLKLPDQA